MIPVLANMGTALVWLGMCHLVPMNIALGVIEGFMLARFLGVKASRLVVIMIGANFASAWAGAVLISPLWHGVIQLPGLGSPLAAAGWMLLGLVALTFSFTIVIEGLIALAGTARVTDASFGRRARAILWTQGMTYGLLLGLYAMVSPVTYVTDLKLVRVSEVDPPPPGWIYFRDREGGIGRVRTTGGEAERVAQPTSGYGPAITLMPDEDGAAIFEHVAHGWAGFGVPSTGITDSAIVRIADGVPLVYFDDGVPSSWLRDWLPRTAKPLVDGDRSAGWAGYAEWGIRFGVLEDGQTWPEKAYAFAMPFDSWRFRSVSLLSDDFAVYEATHDQIMLHDIARERVTVMARGSWPVVVLDAPGTLEAPGQESSSTNRRAVGRRSAQAGSW